MSKQQACASFESELDQLLADLLLRVDGNEPFDIEEVIESHPQYATELRSFFSLSDELADMVGAETPSLAEATVVGESQRSTTSIDSQTVAMLSSLPPADTSAPSTIGKYEVLKELGVGSFGCVYMGYDPLAKRNVAIKVPRSWRDVSQEQRDAFLHEAQSAAALRHEHIVTLLDVYQGDDVSIALIYEHIPGPTMQLVLREHKFRRQEAIGWIASIAEALDYAHRKHVVHRDVKPSNILLTECNGERQPRVVDFGLALLDNHFWHAGDRSRVGAIRYMSPEQAKCNSHWATAQSDVFSLGVILYEALCGRSPWTGKSEREVLREIEQRDPMPPRAIDASISPELERACLKALAKSPTDRYTTAGDLARDLRATIGEPIHRRRNWKSLLAVTSVIALLAAAGFGSLIGKTSAQPSIAPQEVTLSLQIQPSGKPGDSLTLDGDIEELTIDDRLQINAEVAKNGYLYVAWFRPDGEVRLLDERALTAARRAIQEPPVDVKTPWDALSVSGPGKNLVVAFTKPTPLSSDEAETLKRASWQTATDTLGDRASSRTGHPRAIDGPTRGTPDLRAGQNNEPDRYLGNLGTLLKYEWGCYYQAVIFRVN